MAAICTEGTPTWLLYRGLEGFLYHCFGFHILISVKLMYGLQYSLQRTRSLDLDDIAMQLIHIKRFSIECRKTKTKVIITANQNKGKFQREPMRTQSKYRKPVSSAGKRE